MDICVIRWGLEVMKEAFADLEPEIVSLFFGANDAALKVSYKLYSLCYVNLGWVGVIRTACIN